MIDIRKLKELVKLMVANDLSEMDLRDTDEQVTIRRQGDTVVTVPAPVAVTAAVTNAVVQKVAKAQPEAVRAVNEAVSAMSGGGPSGPSIKQ